MTSRSSSTPTFTVLKTVTSVSAFSPESGTGIAIEAARLLERAGVPVTLTHRDMGEAVIERPATA